MTPQPTGQGRPLSPGITAHVSARHANPCRDKARLVSIATPHVPARHANRRDRACPVSTRQTSCGRARISVRAEINFRYNGNKIPCLRKNISARTEFRMPTNHTPPALRATSPILGEELKCFACQGFRKSLANGLTKLSPYVGGVPRSGEGLPPPKRTGSTPHKKQNVYII